MLTASLRHALEMPGGPTVAITFEGKTTAGNFYVAGIEIEENQT